MKNYTYKDWLNGRIGGKGNELEVAVLLFHKKINLYEYHKIKKAQEKAFFWAVELMVNDLKRSAKHRVEKAKNPTEWLHLEIKKVEKFISDNLDVAIDCEEETSETGLISGQLYKKIERFYHSQKEGFYSVLSSIKDGDGNSSKLQKMYAYKKYYLPYLKQLKSEINSGKNNGLLKELDKRPNYHKHRKPEIIEKYKEVRESHKHKSDLDIRGIVQEWYSQQFDKEINEGTIRAYLDQK